MRFDNSYTTLPERFFARIEPLPVPAPKLIAWNERLADELSLNGLATNDEQLAQIFSGNLIPEGADPIALAIALIFSVSSPAAQSGTVT